MVKVELALWSVTATSLHSALSHGKSGPGSRRGVSKFRRDYDERLTFAVPYRHAQAVVLWDAPRLPSM